MLVKISIIVPVFNAENVLIRCVDSILSQTYTNFELLLINDGSTDKSGIICEKYKSTDGRIKYFYQKNAGVSAARNKGIEVSTGDFVSFIDADDYVDSKYLAAFFQVEDDLRNSLVVQGFVKEFKSGGTDIIKGEEKVYSAEDFSAFFSSLSFIRRMPFPFSKLYDAKIIRDKGILFNTNIHFGEDLIFILDYLPYVLKVVVVSESLYNYVQTDGSLSHKWNSYESEIERFYVVKKQLDSIHKKYNLTDKVISFHNSYISRHLVRAFNALYMSPNKKTKKERILILREHFGSETLSIIKNCYIPNRKQETIFKLLFSRKLALITDTYLLLTNKYKISKAQK